MAAGIFTNMRKNNATLDDSFSKSIIPKLKELVSFEEKPKRKRVLLGELLDRERIHKKTAQR